MREDEVYPRWARYRGSITWRKSSRTVSSPRSRFGRSSSFTRDLGVIWRCRGQGRTQKPPRFSIVFAFIDSKLPGRTTPPESKLRRSFLDAGRRNLTLQTDSPPKVFAGRSIKIKPYRSFLDPRNCQHWKFDSFPKLWSKMIFRGKCSPIKQL